MEINKDYTPCIEEWEIPKDGNAVYPGSVMAIDFDGVLHESSYKDWKGPHYISGNVMPGAIDFVNSAINEGWEVVVVSSRFMYEHGAFYVAKWLSDKGFPVERMFWSKYKVPAGIFIDDHAYNFNGSFPWEWV